MEEKMMTELNVDELLSLTPATILGKSILDGADKLVKAVGEHDQKRISQIIDKERQLLAALEIIEQ